MNFKHLYWRLQSKYIKICGGFLRWLPVNRHKIVLNNFQGRGYGDSPKYIAEEIIRQKLPYDLVWLVADLNMELPSGIRKVKLQSVRASYELSTAKVIISNVKVALPYHKKRSQFYIQTWHGSMAFKAIEKDAQEKLHPNYLKETIADSKQIDLFLSCNSVQTQEIQTIFWYDGEIFECGSPRNDMLYRPIQYKDAVKRKLGMDSATKVVLYAPTFRDDFRTDVYNLDLALVSKSLSDRLGGEWRVLVRLHPNVMKENIVKLTPDSIDVTSYPDMQELLLVADVLITDYSTIIYDMAIMRKVILLYAPDLDDYKNNRGLKPIYFNLPSRINQSNDELMEYICRLDLDEYKKRLDEFLSHVQIFDDGKASQRVVERIKSVV
jgi:CDP-glycerol glycerophosphotransferase